MSASINQTGTPDFLPKIRSEAARIEEDCIHSSKSHFNAGGRWNLYHYSIGIPSVVISVAAGTAFFKDYAIVASAMSAVVAVLTALVTQTIRARRHS